MRSSYIAVLALLPSLIAGPLSAQQAPNATAARVSSAPTVDGRLDDAAWAAAQPLTGLVQREPVEGTPVSERTEVRILYDADAIYVGAWLYDRRASAIVLGPTLRDAPLGDMDSFVIVFDTYRDRQNGFVFGTTPAGIEYDAQFTDEGGSAGFGGGGGGGGGGRGGGIGRQQSGSGGGLNLNWDGSWEVQTSTDDQGWYAEMRIPFSTLRYGSGGPQTWGLNFERSIRRNNEQSVWAPVPRQYSVYRVSLAGTLQIEAPSNRIATVTPYVLGDAFKDYQVAAPEVDYGGKVGGDAKFGLTQSLTLDLTVNTDFAQAEVDDQQINLTRFSLFFPEKRAFFLENAGTFSVGAGRSAELFFSRRIGLAAGREVPIHAGARVTGKVGGLQVGLLEIQTGDVSERDETSGTTTQIAPNNNFGVLRAFKEYANRTRIGGIFVSRINTDDTNDYNLTYGLDGQLGVGEALTFDGWASVTTTPVPSGTPDTRSGFNNGEYGYALGGDYLTRVWEASLGYRQIGDDFNPEVGFVNRWAYHRANARLMYHWRTESISWLRELRPHSSYEQYWSLGGFSESYLVHIDNHFVFENGALIQFPTLNLTGEGLEEPFEIHPGIVIPAGTYHNAEWDFRANTNRSAPISFSAGWVLGGLYSGWQLSPNAQIAYRFRDRFTASLRADYYDVRLDEGDFTTAIVQFTGSYAFTPSVYLQANVQYNDDTRDVATNLRFGWLDTAGTGLFIVYNDTEHTGSLFDTGIPGGANQRRLTLKFTRLFNLAR
jgi:hypothetical protein